MNVIITGFDTNEFEEDGEHPNSSQHRMLSINKPVALSLNVSIIRIRCFTAYRRGPRPYAGFDLI